MEKGRVAGLIREISSDGKSMIKTNDFSYFGIVVSKSYLGKAKYPDSRLEDVNPRSQPQFSLGV
jgi:hypothetical protein